MRIGGQPLTIEFQVQRVRLPADYLPSPGRALQNGEDASSEMLHWKSPGGALNHYSVERCAAGYVESVNSIGATAVIAPEEPSLERNPLALRTVELSLRKIGSDRKWAVFNKVDHAEEFSKSIGMMVGLLVANIVFRCILPLLGLLIAAPPIGRLLGCEKLSARVRDEWKALIPIKTLFVGIIGHLVLQSLAIGTFGLLSPFFNRLSGDLERWLNGHTNEDVENKTIGERLSERCYLAACQQPVMMYSGDPEEKIDNGNVKEHISNGLNRGRLLKMSVLSTPLNGPVYVVSMRPACSPIAGREERASQSAA